MKPIDKNADGGGDTHKHLVKMWEIARRNNEKPKVVIKRTADKEPRKFVL